MTSGPGDPDLIADCVHCGFCLPTCPTYVLWGREPDSPRGRIVLMRASHEDGTITAAEVDAWDNCLGCMACVTACPSGVKYDRLIEDTRRHVETHVTRPRRERLMRAALFAVLPHPGRLRALAPFAALGRTPLAQRALRLTPRLGAMAALAPPGALRAAVHRLPVRTEAVGTPRGTVAFLQGCVQRAYFGDVNAATVAVLVAEGFTVLAPRAPRCCGALQLHTGADATALARATVAALGDADFVVTNAAGCGSAMKDYAHVIGAHDFSAKVRDVHELLASVEPRATRHPIELGGPVAYHDACHLAHAQRIREQPRALLRAIPGVELVEPAEWELCCGSAGVYNVLHPEPAAELGARKARNLLATGARTVAAANPGCALQIAAHAERLGTPVRVLHPMELLARSLAGTSR